MNRNDQFRLEKAQQDAERRSQLERARTAAVAAGKEPFDLDVLDALWRDNPDKHSESQGLTISPEERIAVWSEIYYVQYPDILTMSQFVERMRESQVHGFFD